MGLEKREKISYLKISDGKIRMKTTQEDPDAEERYDSINNKYMYERVYSSCTGYIRSILQVMHDEYGTSYNIILFDPENGEKYSVNISESSRYFQSFVMHLPNIDFSQPVTIKPYSFKKDNRLNIGLTLAQNDEKVENFYKEYDEASETSTAMNGLEDFDFSTCEDKHDTKIMQTKLLKFLTSELKREIKRLLGFVESSPEPKNKSTKSVSDDEAEVPAKTKAKQKPAKTKAKQEPVKKQPPAKNTKGKKSSNKKSGSDDLPY